MIMPMIENLDHREAGKTCKSESARTGSPCAAGSPVF
jgi:hypothetical protein